MLFSKKILLTYLIAGVCVIFISISMLPFLPFIPQKIDSLVFFWPNFLTIIFAIFYVIILAKNVVWQQFLQTTPQSALKLNLMDLFNHSTHLMAFLIGFLVPALVLTQIHWRIALYFATAIFFLGLVTVSLAGCVIQLSQNLLASIGILIFCMGIIVNLPSRWNPWILIPPDVPWSGIKDLLGWVVLTLGWTGIFVSLSASLKMLLPGRLKTL